MIVPESYGFKSVKWLNKIILSNRSTSNDTYAQYNNTTESLMKTMARFVAPPEQAQAGTRIPIAGIAQVGSAGLRKVQIWIARGAPEPSDDNRYFHREDWQDVTLLPPPEAWGVAAAEHPAGSDDTPPTRGFSRTQRSPRHWPLAYATAHWATRTPPLPAGQYTLYCRSVDRDGRPQPWPRTLQNDGRNLLHHVPLEVTETANRLSHSRQNQDS